MLNAAGRLLFAMSLSLALLVVAEGSAAEPFASGVSSGAAFLEANEQYRTGRYEEAAKGYRRLLEAGTESGNLYYNLGNALLKGGRQGEALWAYLRAKALMPRDVDLVANLEYTQSLLSAGEAVSVSPPRLVRWLTLSGRFSTEELLCAWTLLFWLAVLCWIIWAWGCRARALLGPVAWSASLAAALVLVVLVVQTRWVDAVPKAVAIVDGAEVKFAPQESGTTHFTLPEGAVVRLLQQQDGWVQVRRGDGRSGWVVAQAVKPL